MDRAFKKKQYMQQDEFWDDETAASNLDALFYNHFHQMTDEEVVLLAQKGDGLAEEYLLCKYKNFVRTRARSYFLMGADHEDIVQEGMIGLFKAIRDYQTDRLSSFKVFAELCITRQILTAIKNASRMKHTPLNSYVSLNKPIYEEDSDRTLLDVLAVSRNQNPEDLFIGEENASSMQEMLINNLSPFEKKVLSDYINGVNYHKIAKKLNRSSKSIDNAIQRIKKKMEKYISDSRHQED